MIGDRKKLIKLREETGLDYFNKESVFNALVISTGMKDTNKMELERSKYILKQLQNYPEGKDKEIEAKEDYLFYKGEYKKENNRVKVLTRCLKKLQK